ncbi:MAG: serine/threonine-protein kinase hal4 [Olpidium bornovanus]|uniref:non-specific serine/threonine protein kinase n=1 Tax=Olpidium bornovanus TaxID=278681 RepID=A0A8H7ZSV2_9FUNG|nr:MAG: serine/threonine-protein kinase hal4 [Olpidium bornovanus]
MVRADIDCLFSQILRGVAYLHSVGIAHRDLKLDNCVVSFFGPQDCRACLKIIDFGCSTVFRVPWETMAHECTGVYGSDPYIPPEEFMCARYDARCADVWAAAVIYVCMSLFPAVLTLRPPASARQFPWRVARPDVDRRFQGYYTLRSSSCIDALAEAQRDVVYRMLEICPSERATAEEVLADPWVSQIETCCQGADRAGDPVLKHAHRHAPIAGILD